MKKRTLSFIVTDFNFGQLRNVPSLNVVKFAESTTVVNFEHSSKTL